MPRLWFKTRELTTEGEEVEGALRQQEKRSGFSVRQAWTWQCGEPPEWVKYE